MDIMLSGPLIRYLLPMGVTTIVLGIAVSIMFGYPRRLWKRASASVKPNHISPPRFVSPEQTVIIPSTPSADSCAPDLKKNMEAISESIKESEKKILTTFTPLSEWWSVTHASPVPTDIGLTEFRRCWDEVDFLFFPKLRDWTYLGSSPTTPATSTISSKKSTTGSKMKTKKRVKKSSSKRKRTSRKTKPTLTE